MKLLLIVIGVIFLVVGGVVGMVGLAEFYSCDRGLYPGHYSIACSSGSTTLWNALILFGGLVFFVGLIVIIIGAVLGVAHALGRSSS